MSPLPIETDAVMCRCGAVWLIAAWLALTVLAVAGWAWLTLSP